MVHNISLSTPPAGDLATGLELFVVHGTLRHLVHAQQHMYSFVVCYDKDDRLSTSCRHDELPFTYMYRNCNLGKERYRVPG